MTSAYTIRVLEQVIELLKEREMDHIQTAVKPYHYYELLGHAKEFLRDNGHLIAEKRVLKYHPKDEPLPDGWVLADDLAGTSHGKHSVLIEEVSTVHDKCTK